MMGMIMTVNRFAPGKALTITVLAALAILIGLGTWQAKKVAPKAELLDRVDAGLSASPMVLPVHVDDPLSIEYRKISFDGEIVTGKSARVYGMNLAGKPGYFIYAPVKRPIGMAVIVNFGWVPLEHEADIVLPEGPIAVHGVLRSSPIAGMMTPENLPEKGLWFNADVHQLAAFFGLKTKEYYHFRIFADPLSKTKKLPLGGQVRVDIPNNHFQYALTWYGLGLSLIGVYIVFGFKRGRKRGFE